MSDYSYEILDLLKKYNGDEAEALKGESSPQCLYAFSPLRENLFEWLEWKKTDRVLQIGSDYGSYTGLLAARAGEVVVVDPLDENLEVNRSRHADCHNIRYVRGNIAAHARAAAKKPGSKPGSGADKATKDAAAQSAGLSDDWREYKPSAGTDPAAAADTLMNGAFDAVVMAGCPDWCEKEEAGILLEYLADFLAPGGILCAAAENEAGVRYQMGARAGEAGFLETEFRALFADLAAAGGGDAMLYYPVPDYRYPLSVYSDRWLPNTGDVTNISARLDGPGFWFGSEEEAMAKACRNGTFPKAANSFFGVYRSAASAESAEAVSAGTLTDGSSQASASSGRLVEYVKYNCTRAEKFRLKTEIVCENGVRTVEKTALSEAGKAHIASFAEKYQKIHAVNPRIRFLEPQLSADGRTASFRYLTGKTIADAIGGEILLGEMPYPALERAMVLAFPEDFGYDEAGKFVIYGAAAGSSAFLPQPEFEAVFGPLPAGAAISGRISSVSNVDGLFENLMEADDTVFGIDYEWVFDFPIPAKLLHFRNLLYFYRRYENVIREGQAELMLHFGISGAEQEIFAAMEESFQTYVHGDGGFDYMKQYEQETKTLEFLLDRESELYKVKEWCEALKQEIAEKDVTIVKQQEVQRLTNNHVSNLDIIIGDLRRENAEIARTLQYLAKHEAIMWKILRKCHQAVDKVMPKGTRKRKILTYFKNTMFHPGKYGKLYLTADGRNRIRGDFKIGEGYLEHGKLRFPQFENPTVSVVIPVYNQIHYTYACLLSILENTGDTSYEIIIADDVSTDATKELNRYVENVVICRNQTNQGFLRNCNNAAKAARGKYVMFLNNDTQVTPGWLSSLVTLLESDPTIGMVGSKLVYPDGRLQEAGGIIWSDGSGWNYGRLDDPDKPEYNYVKDVDYISGAAILLSTALWKQIGGFDDRFAPAYCEDSDLAFEVRKAGYRVVYQPLSKVIHFEGVSNGTDVNGTGLKRYQVENSKKLREKWADEFRRQSVNTGNPNPFRARERSQRKPVILVVDHYVPTWDKDAGSKTTFQYLKMFLEKGYSVKFLGDNFLHEEPYSTTLQQMGIEILYGADYQAGIWDWIEKNKDEIDFAYLNRPHIATKYVDFIREHTDIKIIYYGHDLHFLREYREYELTGDIQKKRDSDYWKSIEFSLMEKAAVSYYPSYVEEEAIHAVKPELKIRAITAYVYEKFLENIDPDFAKREGLLFVGGFAHPPNADAVLWFAREIFPLIRERLAVNFYIVGSKVTEEIKALEQPGSGIIVKGFVTEEELAALYAGCRLVVVPLRYGAGVKGKVIEAVYNGAPIVTTAIGAEGIPEAESVMRIADRPADFADAVVRLYEDPEACLALSEATQTYVRRYFSIDAAWSVIAEDFAVETAKE